MMSDDRSLADIARSIRKNILNVAYRAPVDGVHMGSALSMVDILTALYGAKMNYDASMMVQFDRDRFLLSKGHAALGLYAALYEFAIITKEQLDSFDVNGSIFQALTPHHVELGIDFPGGSLGLGLSYGIGIALSRRLKQQPWHTYVVLGDGECNEGSIWESALFAAHQKVDTLTAIVDRNGLQSDGFSKDIINFDIESIWRAYGWEVIVCNGNDITEILAALNAPHHGKPKAIIAQTVKGKGVSFMENNNDFHRARLSEKQFNDAIIELDGGACVGR
ncbi:transketolase [Pectobacterium brasiliense]|uniref:transketolase n=1 Tax=Pectobacterium brasiliense TaxID=180957 RepID=UPI0031FC62A9